MRALLWLPGGLCNLLPNFLASWHSDIATFVSKQESILEELLDMCFGFLDLLGLLFHALELCHLGCYLSLFLLLLELFFKDLGPGLSPCRRGLHKMARLALGH